MAETVTERVVSVIGTAAAVVENQAPVEEVLKKETSDLEVRANTTPVTTDAEYQEAAEFGKMLKAKAAEVTGFFRPMKDAAHKAHKEICDREKLMLEPLSNAERLVKQSMGAYLVEKERKRKEAEESARRAAEAEANRRLAEAIALEEQGRKEEAAVAIQEAEIIDTASSTLSVGAAAPKVSGVSARKDWEIVKIDEGSVPVNFSGVELRPVDKAAVTRLIRASKGSIKIPGVTYREVASMSFSGR